MKILHITDFHIDSPNSENENLRKGFYQEFLDNLFNVMSKEGVGKIDLILNTGDFINQAKVENYDHAKEVMGYIIKKSQLTDNDVAVCIGNHDFKIKEQGTRDEKIKPFLTFSDSYTPGVLLGTVKRAHLYTKTDSDVQILVIDNSSKDGNENTPCELSTSEADDIILLTRKHVQEAASLIVASHYPMLPFPMSKYVSEEDDWFKSHVWKEGFNLQNRIGDLRLNGQTLFLCGDGHIPDAFRYGNKTYVMTGILGGNYTRKPDQGKSPAKPSYIHTQARIIDFSATEPSVLSTFNYKPLGFDLDPQSGKWEMERSKIREILAPQKVVETNNITRTSVLSEALQDEILSRIRKEKLFKIGRFITSHEYHSLSWVSINRLFEEQQLLVTLIDKCVEWIQKITSDTNKTLIVGVDFWGAIIGTNLAIRLSQPVNCFTSRPLDVEEDSTHLEKLMEAIASIPELQNIIFVTDVVSSGHTLLRIIEKIKNEFKRLNGSYPDFKYHSISVISDKSIVREQFDSILTTIQTACGALKMPILPVSSLPDTEILPSRIDFTS